MDDVAEGLLVEAWRWVYAEVEGSGDDVGVEDVGDVECDCSTERCLHC